MPVSDLNVTDVGPFDELALSFDEQVNIFTGPNNSGKSTLLWVLGELLVYPFFMPYKTHRSKAPTWRIDITSESGATSTNGTLPASPEEMLGILKQIGYTCYIPAQRQSTNYRSRGPLASLGHVPSYDEILQHTFEELISSQLGRTTDIRQSAMQYGHQDAAKDPELTKRERTMISGNSWVSDDAVKQKIIDLDYAAYRRSNSYIRSTLDELASLASDITAGYPLTFERVAEDSGGLYPEFGTPDGALPLDVLSQGTQSIVQFLARFLLGYAEYYNFPPDLRDKPAVLIVDELDAHLHPSWQRRIVPALTNHFPKLQLFCSTHSPMMLAGLKLGQIHLFQRAENGKVSVTRNETDLVGWTADEIFRNMFNIRNPTDQGSDAHLMQLQVLLDKDELSTYESAELERLRQIVRDDLLGGPTSMRVKEFAEELRKSLSDVDRQS